MIKLNSISMFLISAFALSGCAASSGYGTFEGDGRTIEQKLLGSMLGTIGLSGGAKKQDTERFAQRAPLVMPPSEEALPTPQTSQNTQDPDWPQNPNVNRTLIDNKALDEKNQGRARLAPSQLQSEPIAPSKAKALEEDPTRRGYYTDGGSVRLTRQQMKEQDSLAASIRKKQDLGPDGLPKRRYLTDPPKQLRIPTNSAAYSAPEESDRRVQKSNLKQIRGYRDGGVQGPAQ